MAEQTQLVENLKATIEVYLQTAMAAASPAISINFEGATFDDDGIDEWIVPRYGGNVHNFQRQTRSNTHLGSILEILYHVNCYVKTIESTNIHRHAEIRDIVAEALPINQRITVMNYAVDGLSTVGSMQVTNIITDRSIPEDDGVIGWAYSITFDFLYEYLEPN